MTNIGYILMGAAITGLLAYAVARLVKADSHRRKWERIHREWVKENNVKGR